MKYILQSVILHTVTSIISGLCLAAMVFVGQNITLSILNYLYPR